MNALSESLVTRGAKRYRVEIVHDEGMGEPWKEHDGHGIVSDWTRRAKLPGERILCSDRDSHRYYDVRGSVALAKRDGWDAPPYGGTAGQKAARAVDEDFRRLQGWCNDEWRWVGVVVTELYTCDKGRDHDGESASLWGIESDAGDYLTEVANELIDEIESRTEPEDLAMVIPDPCEMGQ